VRRPAADADAAALAVAQCLDFPCAGDIEFVAVPGQTQQQGEPIGEALDAVNLAGSLAICGDPERAADVADVEFLVRAEGHRGRVVHRPFCVDAPGEALWQFDGSFTRVAFALSRWKAGLCQTVDQAGSHERNGD
jgi:hypothetical protein